MAYCGSPALQLSRRVGFHDRSREQFFDPGPSCSIHSWPDKFECDDALFGLEHAMSYRESSWRHDYFASRLVPLGQFARVMSGPNKRTLALNAVRPIDVPERLQDNFSSVLPLHREVTGEFEECHRAKPAACNLFSEPISTGQLSSFLYQIKV